jgi:hypothetical protein
MTKRRVAITLSGIIAGLALWFAIYAAVDIFGWLLVWGDNGPRSGLTPCRYTPAVLARLD